VKTTETILHKAIRINAESMKPVCFFCKEKIEVGEIVFRKESGYYHRKCFNVLFKLTKSHVHWEKVQT